MERKRFYSIVDGSKFWFGLLTCATRLSSVRAKIVMKTTHVPASPSGSSALQRKIQPANLLLGAGVSMFEITTLGQPLEVLKTHLAAHRDCRLRDAISQVWSRGGFKGFYQGTRSIIFDIRRGRYASQKDYQGWTAVVIWVNQLILASCTCEWFWIL